MVMNKYAKVLILIIAFMFSLSLEAKKVVVDVSGAPYFFSPDESGKDNASRLNEVLDMIKSSVEEGDEVVVKLKKGRYDFYPHDALQREYYVSNHDQGQPKIVGICLEQWDTT